VFYNSISGTVFDSKNRRPLKVAFRRCLCFLSLYLRGPTISALVCSVNTLQLFHTQGEEAEEFPVFAAGIGGGGDPFAEEFETG
jgi:hypothetical protein